MPAALAIARDGWAAEDLRALARSSRDAEWTARLLAIALVLDGEGREAAGRGRRSADGSRLGRSLQRRGSGRSSQSSASGACGVVVLDGAGRYRSKGLVVPDNIVLLPLPPYSPELNPMETVIQFLQGNRWSNRVFDSVGAVKAACREAWEWLRSSPERIASLMRREWACLPKVPA